MTLSLTANITATAYRIAITGTVAEDIGPGYQFRLDDELLTLVSFHSIKRVVDRNVWNVERGTGVFASVAHDAGTVVRGATDGFVSSDDQSPPDPFASPSGSSAPLLTVTRVGGTAPFVAALSALQVDDERSDLAAMVFFTPPFDAVELTVGGLGYAYAVGDPFGSGVFPSLELLSLPDLASINIFLISSASLTSLDLSALATVGGDFSPYLPLLTTLDLSALAMVGGSFQPALDSLTTLSLPSLVALGGGISVGGGALDEASVDGILVTLASLDGTGGTTLYENQEIDLSGGTSAPPSATGLAAKATLEGRGCTVTVNEP